MNTSQQSLDVACPYPGLRPFYREESQFFFGREEHIEELLGKLESNRFVAVVGASGCGKSSLVRAGLLPMLENGFMAEAGPNWRIATMRPGNAPFEHLTQALLTETALGPERCDLPNSSALLETTLRRGRFGLVDALRETLLPEGTNLLVLVDQFEEIFRYREQSDVNEAEAFVELLLAAAQHHRDPRQKQREAPVYVLLTMRSDFIGDCALFLGLPEAINASQFLTPRLNRDQCRAAVVGPARAMGGDVDSALVNHLLNNLRADADHLPLLQHVLMRMWRTSTAQNAAETPALTLADLEATGGMENALSSHADEAFQELDQPQQRVAEVMLRSLCEKGADGRATRRLIRLDEVAALADATTNQVYPVVEVFRHPDRSFLMPPPGVPLSESTVLDISHESLIRQWKRLSEWVDDEAASARTYRRLVQTARLWKKGEAALWRTPDLEIAEAWRDKQRPNVPWANRYGGELELSMEFLNKGVASRTKRQRVRRWRMAGAFAVVLLFAAFMAVAAAEAIKKGKIALSESQVAKREKIRAEKQTEVAELAKSHAEIQREHAQRSSYNAGFTGILDQWRLAANSQDFDKRLDAFAEPYRDFTWHFCKSLAKRAEFDPDIVETKHGAVNSLAYLWNDDQLLAGAENGSVHLYNLADAAATPLAVWNHPEGRPILAVKASATTRELAFASDDGTVGIFELSARRIVHLLRNAETRVRTLDFSPDGSVLATAGDNNIISLWDVRSGTLIKQLAGHTNWIASIVFSPDGQTIASSSYDTTIRLWRVHANHDGIVLRGHESPVLSIAWAPDGNRIASGGDDRVIKLWDVGALKCRETSAGHTASINCVSFSSDGQLLVSGDDEGEMRMWSIDDYVLDEAVPPQRRHVGGVNAIVFSPSGRTFSTGSSDSTVKQWDANLGLRLDSPRLECQLSKPRAIAFSADGLSFASVTDSGDIEQWKKNEDGRFTKTAPRMESLPRIPNAFSICYCLQSDLLAVGAKDGSVSVLGPKGPISSKPEDGHTSKVLSVVFDASCQLLASADEQGWINLWKVEDSGLQCELKWKRHTGGVRSLAFAPEKARKKMLASASEDGTVRIWNIESMLAAGKEKLPQAISEFECVLADHDDWVEAVAFSSSRPMLASAGDDGTIRLREWNSWSMTDPPKQTHVLAGHSGAVTAVSFSQDGRTLVSGGVDKMVRLWDPIEGHLRLTVPGHLAVVRSVSFLSAKSGTLPKALASLSDDGALKFWVTEGR